MRDAADESDLDRSRIEALLQCLASAVKQHYLGYGNERRQILVYEALNALACQVALCVAGTAPDGVGDCLEFFSEAFTSQLNSTLASLADEAERDMRGAGLH
jgi:hypothetical protein